MSQRLDYAKLSSDMVGQLFKLSQGLKSSSLEPALLDLVNIRASEINGCAFCVDMHVKEAKIHGERELRLYHVVIWRESTLFSPRERAALEWTEAVTHLGPDGVSDAVFEKVRAVFSEKEISDLTFAVGIINMWNRLSISFRSVPGTADKAFGLEKAGLN